MPPPPGLSLFLFVGAQRRFSLVSFAVVVPKRSWRVTLTAGMPPFTTS